MDSSTSFFDRYDGYETLDRKEIYCNAVSIIIIIWKDGLSHKKVAVKMSWPRYYWSVLLLSLKEFWKKKRSRSLNRDRQQLVFSTKVKFPVCVCNKHVSIIESLKEIYDLALRIFFPFRSVKFSHPLYSRFLKKIRFRHWHGGGCLPCLQGTP